MKITYLPTVHPQQKSDRASGSDSRMRNITRQAAHEGIWNLSLAKEVKDLFDEKASEWSATRNIPSRGVPVQDALERGQVKGKRVVDLGAGTGLATQILRNKFENVIAVDISQEMIVNSVASRTSQICADGFSLPFPNNSIDVFLAMNMILFPDEIERCLRNEGFLIWISSRGSDTPIYLPPEEVIDLMSSNSDAEWSGISAHAIEATWLVAKRSATN